MSITASDIISTACRLAKMVAPEQPVDAYKVEQGRLALNDVIREWGNSENYIPLQSYLSLTLTANQERYTIGKSDSYDFNDYPIINILEANIIDPNNSNNAYFKVEVIDELMYSNIYYRNSKGIPTYVLLRLYQNYSEMFFQVPPYKALVAKLLVKQQLQPVSNTELGVNLSSVPGFALKALKYQTAAQLRIIFGKPFDQDFQSEYEKSIDAYLSNNIGVDPYVKKDVRLGRRTLYTLYPGRI